MVATYNLEINDSRMRGTAKTLISAHICICVLGFLACVLSIASHFTVQAAIHAHQEAEGDVDRAEGEAWAGHIGGLAVIAFSVLGCTIPAIGAFMVWSGVKGNNQGMMKGCCWWTSCCSCCTCIGILGTVGTLLGMIGWQQELDQYDCADATPADNCRPQLYDEASSLLQCVIVITAFELLLLVCSLCACVTASAKGKDAHDSLQKGLVFTGVPVAPPQGGLVVGQPVGAVQPSCAGKASIQT